MGWQWMWQAGWTGQVWMGERSGVVCGRPEQAVGMYPAEGWNVLRERAWPRKMRRRAAAWLQILDLSQG